MTAPVYSPFWTVIFVSLLSFVGAFIVWMYLGPFAGCLWSTGMVFIGVMMEASYRALKADRP